ncbi:MAG: DNA-formamidopyrimidine glycosylase, partial [Bacilli bacterium]|nr:DNA-formamidopyrimidine glycosylase [Bacilli bacterium]
MPELPEVETVKNKLKTRLLSKKILSVDVFWPNTIVDIPVMEFKTKLIDETFIDIKRRGKWLIFELSNYYLLVHLRMEGKFFFKRSEEERNKHEHIIFKLEDIELRFHDTRKFGKMHLLDKEDLMIKKP